MASNPLLVDVRGNPLRRELLDKEIAAPQLTGVRSILSGHPWQGLSPPRLTSILRNAEQGDMTSYLELAEEMEEKDPHYNSVLGTRKRAVAQLPITVEPADESAQAKADADFIRTWTERDTLETELFDILDGIGKGFSFTEIVWNTKATPWVPERLVWRDSRHFEYDRIDGVTPLLRDEGGQLIPLAPAKFIAHIHPAKTGLPARGGIARVAAWGLMFKNYAIKDWVQFLELYGVPMRVGRYDVGAHEGDIRKLAMAVAQIGVDAAATYPRTMDIEFIDGKMGSSPGELWGHLAGYIDDQMSKLVLGQTSSADAKAGGLGSGQANLHGEVRDDIARADARLLAATLNRDLVRPMIDLNFPGRTAWPRIKLEKEDEEDAKVFLETARSFVDMGGNLAIEDVRERAGLPAPKDGETELLIGTGQTADPADPEKTPQNASGAAKGTQGAKTPDPAFLEGSLRPQSGNRGAGSGPDQRRSLNSATEPPVRDAIDDVTDEMLSDWDEMFEAIADPVAEAIATASSAGEAQAAIAKMIATMDVDAFHQMLSRTAFGAHLAGDVDVTREQGGK